MSCLWISAAGSWVFAFKRVPVLQYLELCLLDRSLFEDFLRCLELPKNVTLLAL